MSSEENNPFLIPDDDHEFGSNGQPLREQRPGLEPERFVNHQSETTFAATSPHVFENPFEVESQLEPASEIVLGEAVYGGIGRVSWFVCCMLIIWGPVIFAFMLNLAFPGTFMRNFMRNQFVTVYLTFLLIALLWTTGQRFRNIGTSRLFALTILLPFFNWVGSVLFLFPGLVCLCAPEGYRHHGRLDWPGRIWGVIFLLIFVASLLG